MTVDEAKLNAYLDDELSETERRSLEEHLAASPEVQDRLAQLRQETDQVNRALALLVPPLSAHSSAWLALKQVHPKLGLVERAPVASNGTPPPEAPDSVWESPPLGHELKATLGHLRHRRLFKPSISFPGVRLTSLALVSLMILVLAFAIPWGARFLPNSPATLAPASAQLPTATPTPAPTNLPLLPPGVTPISATLTGGMGLVGYQLPQEVITADQEIPLTLYWRPPYPLEKGYMTFARLVDSRGAVLSEQVNPLFASGLTTSSASPGLINPVSYFLTTAPGYPGGQFEVVVGVYEASPAAQSPLYPGASSLTEDSLRLAQVTVKNGISKAGFPMAITQEISTTPIFVALQPISQGSKFTAGSIALRPWPVTALPQGFIIDEAETIGRIARHDIVQGQVIVRSMLMDAASPYTPAVPAQPFTVAPIGQMVITSGISATAIPMQSFMVAPIGQMVITSGISTTAIPSQPFTITPMDQITMTSEISAATIPIQPFTVAPIDQMVITSGVSAPALPAQAFTVTPASQTDIVIVLDISGSMAAEDLQPNRLSAAKAVINDFIDHRPGDRIGFTSFAGEVVGQIQPTLDHAMLKGAIESTRLAWDSGIDSGTAIGLGLNEAVEMLQDSAAGNKVIILITDGANNAGAIDPLVAAKQALAQGIRVYTIGVAQQGPARLVFPDGRVEYRDSEIDEASLQQIAALTGGRYFRAEDNQSLAEIYNSIDQLEGSFQTGVITLAPALGSPSPILISCPTPPPAPISYLPFESSTLGFSLAYPEGWQQKEYDSYVIFSPSEAGLDPAAPADMAFWIGRMSESAPPPDLNRLNWDPSFRLLNKGPMMIDSQGWDSIQFIFDTQALCGQGVGVDAAIIQPGSHYFLGVVAPAPYWNEVQPIFQEMLNSFRFKP